MDKKNQGCLKLLFPDGLIGLEEYRNFELRDLAEQEQFKILQCLDDDSFGLVVTSPFWFSPDYSFKVPSGYTAQLAGTDNLDIFVVVTLAAKPQDVTANLLGPIVINTQAGKGYQILASDEQYSTRHKLCLGGRR